MAKPSLRRRTAWLLAGAGVLIALCGVAAFLPAAAQGPAAILAVAGFLFCWQKGLSLWHVDDVVMERRRSEGARPLGDPISFPRVTVRPWRVESGATD